MIGLAKSLRALVQEPNPGLELYIELIGNQLDMFGIVMDESRQGA